MTPLPNIPPPNETEQQAFNQRYPPWAPRFWHGMRLRDYLALLYRNRFRVSPSRWHLAAVTFPITATNSLLALIQYLFYGSRIAKTELRAPPLFIIGHFRTGTTHLYELLARDNQFAFPTTYECFAPTHFLLTEKWIPQLISWLLPTKRPMDEMAVGLGRPQEDEFALIGLGGPTLYYRMAFPNERPPAMSTLNSDTMSTKDKTRLSMKLRWFYQALSVRKNRRLLVKSPLHTGRIPMLTETFPGAQFIHIVRDPRSVIPSLAQSWSILDQTQGFQTPLPEMDRDLLISESFEAMYCQFERHVSQLPTGSLCEVCYENLVQDPLGELARIYTELNLGDFESVRPVVHAYLQSLAGYQTNKLPRDEMAQMNGCMKWYCERYKYEAHSPNESTSVS